MFWWQIDGENKNIYWTSCLKILYLDIFHRIIRSPGAYATKNKRYEEFEVNAMQYALYHTASSMCKELHRISIVNVLVEKLFDQLLEQHNWKHELNIYCAENRHEMFKSSVAFLVAFFFLLCSSKRIIDLGISLLWHKHGTWKPTNLKHIIPFSQAYCWYFICLFLLMIPLWNAHLLRNAI